MRKLLKILFRHQTKHFSNYNVACEKLEAIKAKLNVRDIYNYQPTIINNYKPIYINELHV